jgi:hypothetical protein
MWVYHKSGGVIAHHPNAKCNTCREYTMHRAMEAYSLNTSLEKAIEEHVQAVSERYVRDLAEAESKLLRYRIECDNDRHEILKLQDKLDRAYDDLDDLEQRLKRKGSPSHCRAESGNTLAQRRKPPRQRRMHPAMRPSRCRRTHRRTSIRQRTSTSQCNPQTWQCRVSRSPRSQRDPQQQGNLHPLHLRLLQLRVGILNNTRGYHCSELIHNPQGFLITLPGSRRQAGRKSLDFRLIIPRSTIPCDLEALHVVHDVTRMSVSCCPGDLWPRMTAGSLLPRNSGSGS